MSFYKSERHLALAAEFSDTGPAVQCCDQACNQGRLCPLRRSESVGAEWEPARLDSDARSMLWWLLGGMGLMFAVVLSAHFVISFLEM